MKSTPILMKPAMASATLADIKTHTRRTVQWPLKSATDGTKRRILIADDLPLLQEILKGPFSHPHTRFCPYGMPGDRLWVREPYFEFGHWEPVKGVKTKGGRQKWRFVRDKMGLFRYSDNPPEEFRKGRHAKDPATSAWHRRLARFMPRALSRITLEIVEVRIERLNNISESDAIAEGIGKPIGGCFFNYQGIQPMPTGRESYRTLWESINGPGSFGKNPLVWVVIFKRLLAVKPTKKPSE